MPAAWLISALAMANARVGPAASVRAIASTVGVEPIDVGSTRGDQARSSTRLRRGRAAG